MMPCVGTMQQMQTKSAELVIMLAVQALQGVRRQWYLQAQGSVQRVQGVWRQQRMRGEVST